MLYKPGMDFVNKLTGNDVSLADKLKQEKREQKKSRALEEIPQ